MKLLKEYIATADGVKQMWNRIHDILDGFDFGKIDIAMEALGWEWSAGKSEIEELKELGRTVHINREFPELSTYVPEVEDIRKHARKMLEELVYEAAEYQEKELDKDKLEDYPTDDKLYYTTSTGGFDASISILDDDTRKEVFGDDAPDDFEHSVDIVLKFVIEENFSIVA